MFLSVSSELEELRAQLRAYFERLMTPQAREAIEAEGEGGPTHRRLLRQMGSDGWLGIGWPVEYGGQGRGPAAQFVFFGEAYRAGAPLPMVTLNTVGPTLMRFGTEEQKARFLQGILAGELVFSIGYTEAEAGTDLASLRTRAVRDGDEWVIDGGKVFTSHAQHADWIWLACRTDTEGPKHHGLSIILVPTAADGFSVTPIPTVGGLITNATYYDNVRVPLSNLVGEEHRGWELITNQLNHERVALAALSGNAVEVFEDVLAWARETPSGYGRRVVDIPWVQARLAEADARLAAVRLVNWRLVSDAGAGRLNPGDSSAAKVLGTETAVTVYRLLLEVLGAEGTLRAGSPGTLLQGKVERMNRQAQINTFGGGVNEVQREIVATARLGMARAAR